MFRTKHVVVCYIVTEIVKKKRVTNALYTDRRGRRHILYIFYQLRNTSLFSTAKPNRRSYLWEINGLSDISTFLMNLPLDA